MEKVFSWKVLVAFCTIFIVSWVALQTVSNMRLEGEAELIGDKIFNWQWPDATWQSKAEMTQASIIRKSDNDAVIKVTGTQILTTADAGQSLDNPGGKTETVECSAVLTLYKQSGKWVLGRVEL